MAVTRVSPDEARQLAEEDGYVLLDVRSVPEFEQGHPAGAYNVPLLHMGAHGLASNGEFLPAVARTFGKDAKLVLCCKSGGRSLRAAQILVEAGYATVVDQRAGFSGAVDGFGRLVEKGWQACGLPVATRAEPGRSWAELSSARGGK